MNIAILQHATKPRDGQFNIAGGGGWCWGSKRNVERNGTEWIWVIYKVSTP